MDIYQVIGRSKMEKGFRNHPYINRFKNLFLAWYRHLNINKSGGSNQFLDTNLPSYRDENQHIYIPSLLSSISTQMYPVILLISINVILCRSIVWSLKPCCTWVQTYTPVLCHRPFSCPPLLEIACQKQINQSRRYPCLLISTKFYLNKHLKYPLFTLNTCRCWQVEPQNYFLITSLCPIIPSHFKFLHF